MNLSADCKTNNSIAVKISKNVLKRFEHNIDNGKVFLYNIANNQAWVGNSSANDFLRKIDGEKSLDQIYKELFDEFEDYTIDELENSFGALAYTLIENQFLELADG